MLLKIVEIAKFRLKGMQYSTYKSYFVPLERFELLNLAVKVLQFFLQPQVVVSSYVL